MTLSARAIAVQGFGFSSLLVAQQGFGSAEQIQVPGGSSWQSDAGRSKRIRNQNQALIAMIAALAAQGALQ